MLHILVFKHGNEDSNYQPYMGVEIIIYTQTETLWSYVTLTFFIAFVSMETKDRGIYTDLTLRLVIGATMTSALISAVVAELGSFTPSFHISLIRWHAFTHIS